MRIEIISASAGSGKTYKLSELLLNAVKEDNVRPDAILATTFTIKAAAELQERVRTRLLSGKLTTQAQQLSAARIGTVNSVCGGLLQDFAFYLGISPEQRVLEEDAVAGVIAKSMAGEIDTKLSGEMYQLERRFQGLDIRKEVSAIIGKARANGLSGADLLTCGRRSVEEYQRLFGETHTNGVLLDQQLRDAIHEFLRDVDIKSDTTKITKEARDTVQQLQRCMQQQVYLPWNEWHRLSTLKTGKNSQDVADPLKAAAAVHDNHPRLKEDAQRLITLTFDIAARALTAYQEYKRRWGVIDFTDQEALALKLLQMQEPAKILSERLDLVLVDEFQDTSPIQLAIFLKLAALANRSVWVGDQKQAIYGFRDADPSLQPHCNRVTITRVKRKSIRQIKAQFHTLAVFGEAQSGTHFLGGNISLSKCLFRHVKHGLVRYQRVPLGNHTDRDKALIISQWSADNGIKSPIYPATFISRLGQGKGAPFKFRHKEANLPQGSFIKTQRRIEPFGTSPLKIFPACRGRCWKDRVCTMSPPGLTKN